MRTIHRTWITLAITALLSCASAAIVVGNASATSSGYFCGTPTSPYHEGAYGYCVHGAYHSQINVATVSVVSGVSSICVANSSTAGTYSWLSPAACTNGAAYTAWECALVPGYSCSGYASYIGGPQTNGNYYGWMQVA